MHTIPPVNPPIIETVHLGKKSGAQIRIQDLHMQVPPRCVYGLLGPAGAGKTTTLKLLLGILKPTTGKVILFGQEMTERNRLKLLKNTGSLIEAPGFYDHLTGAENLEIIARLKGLSAGQVMKALHTVRLYGHKDQLVKHYSPGMKQCLGIAAAIIGNPRILILDEPTNRLDPAGIREIREFIRTLPSKHGITVIVSGHLPSEMEQLADYVGIINHGEMIFQGNINELYTQSNLLKDIFYEERSKAP